MAHVYDTSERDLERAGMALSRQPSEAGVDWRLVLPGGEEVEAWEPGTSGLVPPPEIARLIESVTARRDLVPVQATAPAQPSELASGEYARFEELARRLLRTPGPRQAGSGAA